MTESAGEISINCLVQEPRESGMVGGCHSKRSGAIIIAIISGVLRIRNIIAYEHTRHLFLYFPSVISELSMQNNNSMIYKKHIIVKEA